jgi:hypothetical protein
MRTGARVLAAIGACLLLGGCGARSPQAAIYQLFGQGQVTKIYPTHLALGNGYVAYFLQLQGDVPGSPDVAVLTQRNGAWSVAVSGSIPAVSGCSKPDTVGTELLSVLRQNPGSSAQGPKYLRYVLGRVEGSAAARTVIYTLAGHSYRASVESGGFWFADVGQGASKGTATLQVQDAAGREIPACY